MFTILNQFGTKGTLVAVAITMLLVVSGAHAGAGGP